MTSSEQRHRAVLLACFPAVAMVIVTLVDLTAGPTVGFLPLVSLGRPSPD